MHVSFFIFYRLLKKRKKNGKWLTFFSFSKNVLIDWYKRFQWACKMNKMIFILCLLCDCFQGLLWKEESSNQNILYDSLALLNWKCDHLEHFYIYLCSVCVRVCVSHAQLVVSWITPGNLRLESRLLHYACYCLLLPRLPLISSVSLFLYLPLWSRFPLILSVCSCWNHPANFSSK